MSPRPVLPLAGITLLFILFQVNTIAAVTESDVAKRLFSNYDPTVRSTNSSAPPTAVKINFYVRDLYVIDQSMHFIGAQLTFRQSWNDNRLSYPETQFPYLSFKDPEEFWTPDIFFSNSRKGYYHNLMQPNVLLRVYPDGTVLYSRRLTVELRCQINSRMFPIGKLRCPVVLASYGFTTEQVVLDWKSGDPVQVTKMLSIQPFRLKEFTTFYCTSRTNTGEYSCLNSQFVLQRACGSVFYILYLPPLLVVLLGWVSFFIHRKIMKTRLSLLLMTVLLGSLCCANTLWHDPESLVVTAADVWAGVCLAFVAYALLHLLMTRTVPCLTYICGKDVEKTTRDVTLQPMLASEGGEQGGEKLKHKLQARLRLLVANNRNRADVIALILYPMAFLAFNAIYWTTYKE